MDKIRTKGMQYLWGRDVVNNAEFKVELGRSITSVRHSRAAEHSAAKINHRLESKKGLLDYYYYTFRS